MLAHSGDRGETLIEVLLALMIIGIAAVALLTGLSTGIFSSALHREQTVAGTVLESVGETLNNNAYNPYVNCATTTSYNPEGGFTSEVPAGGWTVTINQIEWWDGNTNGFVLPGSQPCPDTNSDGFLHLQLIGVTVTSPDGQTTQSRSFFKRGA